MSSTIKTANHMIKHTLKFPIGKGNTVVSSLIFTILGILIFAWAVPQIATFFGIPFQSYMIYMYWCITLIIFSSTLPSIQDNVFIKEFENSK